MDKLTKLRDELTQAAASVKEWSDKLAPDANEEDRTAWRTEWDERNKAYDVAKQAVADEEKRLKEQDEIRERTAAIEAESQDFGRIGRDGARITSQRLAAEDDEDKRGFKNHREFLLSVMETGKRGRITDDRLNLCRSPLNVAGADEQSTFDDPYGGFLIPEGFLPDLLMVMAEEDPISGLVTQIPMENAVVKIPARVDKTHTNSVSGGLRVYRRAEADTSSSSRMEVEQVTLTATSLFGLAYSTEELLDRSPMSFVALLEAGFRDEFRAKLMEERLDGTGAGEFEGVRNSPAVVSVAKESGQAADTIVKENIDNMRSRCWGYGRAVWLYNHDALPQLRSLVQNVGTGGAPVPYFQVDANGNSTLDGRPAFATEFAQTIGDSGDIILGNWSQYIEGTLSGLRSAESIHVRFINHERTFKFWLENDGRCWWRSALTPKNSSNTLSPFVVLDARA